ncbi:MAG: hypothetical protein ABSC46_00650 [Candidatus Limnocylindrales bacterium]
MRTGAPLDDPVGPGEERILDRAFDQFAGKFTGQAVELVLVNLFDQTGA